MVVIHNETKSSPPIWRIIFLHVACIGGNCRRVLSFYFLLFSFCLAPPKVGHCTKETKKSRLPNVIKQKLRRKKLAQPKPFLCYGRAFYIQLFQDVTNGLLTPAIPKFFAPCFVIITFEGRGDSRLAKNMEAFLVNSKTGITFPANNPVGMKLW